MGKSESAIASLGIKILLSDLIFQINKKNFKIINEMLINGFIEDSNEYYNEVYQKIINCDELPKNYIELIEHLTNHFKTNGSYIKSKLSHMIEPDLHKGCLFDKELLVPIKEILNIERYGYDRSGINSISRPIDFDLSVDIRKYKEIKKYKIVFLLKQHSSY